LSSVLVTKTSPTSKSAYHLSELNSSFSKIASFLRVEQSCGSILCKIVCACDVSSGIVSREISMHNQSRF
jgi:hypothetical protein